MHKLGLTLLALPAFGTSSLSWAQKRVEVGVFVDYLSVSQTSTNNFGLGGRLGYRIHRNVMFEGELAYDYGLNFDEAFRNITNGNMVAIERTSIGVTHGLFGPTLKRPGSGFHPFITLKGGFVDFRLSPSLIPSSAVLSAVSLTQTMRAGLSSGLPPLTRALAASFVPFPSALA